MNAETPAYPGDLLEHLRSFAALGRRVEHDPRRAFDRTAHALSIDASVLRRRVQTLGRYYGVPLLEGRGATLRLSREGTAIVRGADAIVRELERVRRDVGAARNRLSIACTGTVTTQLLPEVLRELASDEPGLEVDIRRAGAVSAADLLARGEADLAVVRSAEAPSADASRKLCRDRLWLALPSKHALARRRRLSLEELAGLSIVSFRPQSSTRRRIMSVLEPLGARVRIEVDGRAAALRYTELGMGAAFLSVLPGHRVHTGGVVLRDVTRSFPTSWFWLCWRPGRSLSELEKRVVRALVERTRS